MGLDTSHDCWHGAYSSFDCWRTEICRAAGYGGINKREGFGGKEPWPVPLFNSESDISGMAAAAATDPILVLLMHSDCDGIIPAAHCAAIADRLDAILPKVRNADAGRPSHVDDTATFARGLRLAAERGEDVEFH